MTKKKENKITKKNKNCADVAPKKSKLDNLKKGIPFTPETARECQAKAVKKRKENRAYKEVAQEGLSKLLGSGAIEAIINIDKFLKLDTYKQLAILEHLANYSGQKPTDKQEIQATNANINVDDKTAIDKVVEKLKAL